MSFGKRLREARQSRHLSQAALAETLGISLQSIGRWEREETIPQAHYRLQLSRFFDILPEELFQDLENQEQRVSPHSAIWRVPYARNPYFVGRDDVLQQIHHFLQSPPTGGGQPVAISGLGGMGKTQIALEYIYRFGNTYEAVIWLQAETRDMLLSELVALAPVLQVSIQQNQKDTEIIEEIKQWFRLHAHWLLVLDDIEDLTILNQIDLPRVNGNGHLLLTTLSQFTGALAEQINLDVLEEEEGSLFLLRRSKLLPPNQPLEEGPDQIRETAKQLVHVLGGLPLALDQAGAYIEETGCSLADYLRRYARHRLSLLSRRGIMAGNNHSSSVVTTMVLAYERVKQLNLVAAQILRICTFLHPYNIPEEIVVAAIPLLDPQELSLPDQEEQLDGIFVTLRSLSLIIRHAELHAFCICPLVHAILRDTIEPELLDQWMERAIRTVNAAFPEDARWPIYEAYLPHIQACRLLITQFDLHLPEAAHLLYKAGSFLLKRGRATEAEQFLTQALALQETLSGPASSERRKILHCLAVLRATQDEKQTS